MCEHHGEHQYCTLAFVFVFLLNLSEHSKKKFNRHITSDSGIAYILTYYDTAELLICMVLQMFCFHATVGVQNAERIVAVI